MDLHTHGLARTGEGFDVTEGEFVWQALKTYVKFEGFDGFVKLLWRGSKDLHCTMPSSSTSPERWTQWGSSTQISKRFEAACKSIRDAGGSSKLGVASKVKVDKKTGVETLLTKDYQISGLSSCRLGEK